MLTVYGCAYIQQIKEELNSYKMEEMDVHPSSRQLTHFCEYRFDSARTGSSVFTAIDC